MREQLPALFTAMAAALAACEGETGAMLGTLERDRVELVAEAQETIVEISVREGARVAEGAVLLRLDPASAEARLAQARANALQAERRHAETVAGARKEQVSEARALGAGARASRERLAELVSGTRAEIVEQTAAALEVARAQVTELELSLARYTVRATRAGVVDALPYELGERPPRGAPIVVLLAAGSPYARVHVPETLRATVAPGDPAIVRIDGTDRDWNAEVRYISSEAAFTPYYALNERDRARLSYLAEFVLTEAEAANLPTGIPVEAFLTGSRAGP